MYVGSEPFLCQWGLAQPLYRSPGRPAFENRSLIQKSRIKPDLSAGPSEREWVDGPGALTRAHSSCGGCHRSPPPPPPPPPPPRFFLGERFSELLCSWAIIHNILAQSTLYTSYSQVLYRHSTCWRVHSQPNTNLRPLPSPPLPFPLSETTRIEGAKVLEARDGDSWPSGERKKGQGGRRERAAKSMCWKAFPECAFLFLFLFF